MAEKNSPKSSGHTDPELRGVSAKAKAGSFAEPGLTGVSAKAGAGTFSVQGSPASLATHRVLEAEGLPFMPRDDGGTAAMIAAEQRKRQLIASQGSTVVSPPPLPLLAAEDGAIITTEPASGSVPSVIDSGAPTSSTSGVGASIAAAVGTAAGVETAAAVSESAFATDTASAKVRKKAKPSQQTIKVVIRSRVQVIAYLTLIIRALEDSLEYDPKRQHNQPPPELRLDDARYLQEIRNLVVELKRLNQILETSRSLSNQKKQHVVDVRKHLNTFLDKYAGAFGRTMGVGTGMFALAAISQLYYLLGGSEAAGFDHLIKALKVCR